MFDLLKVSVFKYYWHTTVTRIQGFIPNERLYRQSATDINPTEGGEMRENISCVSGEQGEKLQFTVCNGSTPLSYWSPSSCSVLVALCLSCGMAKWKDNCHRISDSNV